METQPDIGTPDPHTRRITDFLRQIGLTIRFEPIPVRTFLPGILIHDGGLTVDVTALRHPGDLLHEAGHLAVVPQRERCALGGYVGKNPADEMAAIAWSWAALRHLGLEPEVVFHPEGYRGASASLINAFAQDMGPGTPLLEWYGLTSAGMPTSDPAMPLFPTMSRWLRE
ncbi:MAG: hypothetical protein ACPGU7_11940 [Gammaproteobacteria bacterium]